MYVIQTMRSDFFQRTASVDLSIACDIKMITDIMETPMMDVILSASLHREGFSLRCGTAMNDEQRDGSHKPTYNSVHLSTLR